MNSPSSSRAELMTMLADDARERFQKIRVSFPQPPAGLDWPAP